jgi:hypothetical protein
MAEIYSSSVDKLAVACAKPTITFLSQSPFYPKDIYALITKMMMIANEQFLNFAVGGTSDGSKSDSWQNAESRRRKLNLY